MEHLECLTGGFILFRDHLNSHILFLYTHAWSSGSVGHLVHLTFSPIANAFKIYLSWYQYGFLIFLNCSILLDKAWFLTSWNIWFVIALIKLRSFIISPYTCVSLKPTCLLRLRRFHQFSFNFVIAEVLQLIVLHPAAPMTDIPIRSLRHMPLMQVDLLYHLVADRLPLLLLYSLEQFLFNNITLFFHKLILFFQSCILLANVVVLFF